MFRHRESDRRNRQHDKRLEGSSSDERGYGGEGVKQRAQMKQMRQLKRQRAQYNREADIVDNQIRHIESLRDKEIAAERVALGCKIANMEAKYGLIIEMMQKNSNKTIEYLNKYISNGHYNMQNMEIPLYQIIEERDIIIENIRNKSQEKKDYIKQQYQAAIDNLHRSLRLVHHLPARGRLVRVLKCFFKAAHHLYHPFRQIEHLSSLFVRFERSLLCLSFFV